MESYLDSSPQATQAGVHPAHSIEWEINSFIDSLQNGHNPRQRGCVRLTSHSLVPKGTGSHLHHAMFTEDRRVILALGRIDGDALRAALVRAAVSGALKSSGRGAIAPLIMLKRLSDLVCGVNDNLGSPPVDCSLVYAMMDLAERRMTYWNAGHTCALIAFGDNTPRMLSPTMSTIGRRPLPARLSPTTNVDFRGVSRLAIMTGEQRTTSSALGSISGRDHAARSQAKRYARLDQHSAQVLSTLRSEFLGMEGFEGTAILLAEFLDHNVRSGAGMPDAKPGDGSADGPPPDPSIFLG